MHLFHRDYHDKMKIAIKISYLIWNSSNPNEDNKAIFKFL